MTTGTVNATTVNVRRPTPDGNIVGILERGARVEVVDGVEQQGCYFVSSLDEDNGIAGFVGKQFVTLGSGSQTTGWASSPNAEPGAELFEFDRSLQSEKYRVSSIEGCDACAMD